MKKIIAIIVLSLIGVVVFAQNNNKQQVLKYVTHFPNGSIAVMITDNSSKNGIKIESEDSFYRYEILEKETSEAVSASKNEGKECIVNKTDFKDGSYNLRLYTSNFIITTDLEILKIAEFNAILKDGERVVVND